MDLYQVGAITQTHGVRGEVKVFPLTDDVCLLYTSPSPRDEQ